MLYGLDLFSGIGGITLALSEWVKPIAYCEIEPYAQKVLLSRMSQGQLPIAPIWDDVRSLSARDLPKVDIIYGGFPCQDISIAGRKAGIAKETRSGLFYEIMRLTDELKPSFLFLENVPNIRNQGLDKVLQEITDRGFNCRWGILSAAEVGAWHQRKRWWLFAYRNCSDWRITEGSALQSEIGNTERQDIRSVCQDFSYSNSSGFQTQGAKQQTERAIQYRELSYPNSKGLEGQRQVASRVVAEFDNISLNSWWAIEPDVGRVVNGLPSRVDRIKSLGNAVVPECAREAFKRLVGI